MKPPRRIASPWLAAVLLAGCTRRPAEPSTPEEVFALLDRFDPLDTSTLPFVKVATGRWCRYDSDPPQNQYRFGFLIGDEGGRFTVRFLDLTRETFSTTPEGKPEHERVGYERLDLVSYAREFGARLVAERDESFPLDFYLRPDRMMHPRPEALLLARACERRGLRAEVQTLFEAAGRISTAVGWLASGLADHLDLDFANPDLSRAQLFERHRRWLDAFPESWEREWVERQTAILDRMVAEDRARLGRWPTYEKTLRKGQVVEDLIFSLRDEYHPVKDWFFDGHFVSTPVPKPEEGSRPSDKLRDLGFDAVPALIEAVTDDTLTRCVWYSSRYGGSFKVLSVGTFATEILERISRIEFYGKPEELRAAWLDWWKMVSGWGEEAALAELASRGDSASERAAELLLERWPGRFEDVLQGVRRAENRWYRQELISIVARIGDERVTEFLLEELRKGPYVGARVEAARALLDRGRREGLDLFMKEWLTAAEPRERRQPDVPEAVADFDFAIALTAAQEAMGGFLLSSGDLGAVRTVAGDILQQPANIRRSVLESLREPDLEKLLGRAGPEARPAIEREIEGILASLLDDMDRHSGSSMGFTLRDRSISLQDPLTADLAACQLVRFWPDRYDYDPTGPTRLRMRRLAHVKNVWRARCGFLPIEIPAPPDVRSRDPEVRQGLDRLVRSESAGERRNDVARLEAAGLGALPWVEDRLGELPAEHPARRDLEELADRLANIVREATLDSGTLEAPEELRIRVADLQGKRLDFETVLRLLRTAIEALPGGKGAIELQADRLGDGTGITVELKAFRASGGEGRCEEGYQIAVSAGGRLIESTSGAILLAEDRGPAGEMRRELKKAIDAALATHHRETFEIRMEPTIR